MMIPVLDIQLPEGDQVSISIYFCAIAEADATIYTYLAFFENNTVGAYLTLYVLLFLVLVLFVPTL